MARACDGCTMCCKVTAVTELQKPMGVWCPHVEKGRGCAIYERRPQSCRSFNCAWLTSPDMPDYWKPDRSKMVVAGNRAANVLNVAVDPSYPDVWRKSPYYTDMKGWALRLGALVQVLSRKQAWFVFPEEDLHEPDSRPDDEIMAFGYVQHRLMRQPAVTLRRSDGTLVELTGALHQMR